MSGLPVRGGVQVPLLDVKRQNDPLREEFLAAIAEVCDSGAFVFGPDCSRLEQEIQDYCGSRHAIGCASGSDALLLALMAYDIGPGDEVILPSFTFFATASAVWRLGARPVFVDIEASTFNIDPAAVESAVTSATKAIIPVHLFGACAQMTAIGEIADRHNIRIIEDCAQSIGADHQGVRSGAIGDIGCFSFYPTKNLGGFGDGGMITVRDEAIVEKIQVLRDHGQSPRYHHRVVGVNSRLDSIQAAVLRVKLPYLDNWATMRDLNANRYYSLFKQAGLEEHVTLPKSTLGDRHVWNQYTIRVPNGKRDALQKHLAEQNIGSAIYYPIPLHRQECFASLGMHAGSLPETERAAEEVLSLPIFPELTAVEQEAVVAGLQTFFKQSVQPIRRAA